MGWFSSITDSLGLTNTGADADAKRRADEARAAADAAAAAAAAEATRINKQKADYAQSLQELQAQESTSLNTNTLTNVVVGGTAADSAVDIQKKKKLAAPSLSTQLGVNV
jgi:hypothetical protein